MLQLQWRYWRAVADHAHGFSRFLRMQHHQDSHLKIFGRDCIATCSLGVNLDDAASANDCVHHFMHYTKTPT